MSSTVQSIDDLDDDEIEEIVSKSLPHSDSKKTTVRWNRLMRQIVYNDDGRGYPSIVLAGQRTFGSKQPVHCPIKDGHAHGDKSPSAAILMGNDFAGLSCFVCGKFGVLDLGVKCGYAKTRESVARKLKANGFDVPATPQKIDALESKVVKLPVQAPKPSSSARFHVVPASELKSKRIEWFLPGFIPFGAFCLLQGDGGIGKTTLVLDWIARASRGSEMPDDSRPFSKPRASIVIAGEDGDDKLKARLQAAEANMDIVQVLRWVDEDNLTRPFTLPDDIDPLLNLITEKEASIVYIDSLFDALSLKIDSNKDQEVRSALRPLGDLAEKTGVVILGTRHIKKEGTGRATHRGMGSVAFSNVARSVLSIAPHPNEPETFLVSVAKRNYGKNCQSLRYQIVTANITADDGKTDIAGKIKWLGFDAMTADEAALATPSKGSLAENAIVQAINDHGSFRKKEIADKLHLSEDTVCRAMEQLKAARGWNFKCKRSGFGEGAYWEYRLSPS